MIEQNSDMRTREALWGDRRPIVARIYHSNSQAKVLWQRYEVRADRRGSYLVNEGGIPPRRFSARGYRAVEKETGCMPGSKDEWGQPHLSPGML